MGKGSMRIISKNPVEEEVCIRKKPAQDEEKPSVMADFLFGEDFVSFSAQPCPDDMS